MRIVFMGTPEFAVPALQRLAQEHEVALVLTRPDAVRGRGRSLEASPVKAAALELGLSVRETARMTPEICDEMRALAADMFCVAAYGCILPQEVIDMPRLDCLNIHASLLPRWRGAAPIQRCILAGDERAGVSIMRIGQGVDTGAYCAQTSCEVGEKTAEELTQELSVLGADLLAQVVANYESKPPIWTEQDETLVTHAAKITKQEMLLDPHYSALQVSRLVRASSQAAPARCVIAGRGVRVIRVAMSTASASLEPGAFSIEHGHVYMGCSDGVLELLSVKPDGKREMDARSWSAGLQVSSGIWERLS